MRNILALVALALVGCSSPAPVVIVDVEPAPDGDAGAEHPAALQAPAGDDGGAATPDAAPSPVDPLDAGADAPSATSPGVGDGGHAAPADAAMAPQLPAAGCAMVDGQIACGECDLERGMSVDGGAYCPCGSDTALVAYESYVSPYTDAYCSRGDGDGGLIFPWSWCPTGGGSQESFPCVQIASGRGGAGPHGQLAPPDSIWCEQIAVRSYTP